MARQRKVFGIPIGKKKPLVSPKTVMLGVGLAASAGPAYAAVRKAAGAASSGIGEVKKAKDVADTASNIVQSVGEHSSTIGKVGAIVGEIRHLGGDGKGGGAPKLSHLIEEHIEVAVPRSVAYNQWTQFETFPSIVKGAERVEQKERDQVEWTSKIGPSRRTWGGEITEQVPDERISWRSKGGLRLKGVVTFHSLDEELTRVLVEMEYDPKGPVESVGNLLRIQRRRVRRDLRLFKHFVELRGEETGAWRQRIAKKDEDGKESGKEDQESSEDKKSSEKGSSDKVSSGSQAPSASSNGSTTRRKTSAMERRTSTARASKSSSGSHSSTVRAGGTRRAAVLKSAGSTRGSASSESSGTSRSSGSSGALGTRGAGGGRKAASSGSRRTTPRRSS